MRTRRAFLKDMTIAGGLCLAGAGAIKGAARKLSRIGVQLYTVRTELAKDFEGTLGKVAALGYQEVEFAGYYNRTPQQVREVLKRHRLASPAAHIPIGDLRDKMSAVIDAAKTIGHRYVICPWLDPNERRSLDDYKRHAELFNRAGEACQKAGLQFGYHNHDFEFHQLGGQMPYDLLLKECDPKLVKMELDLYWVARGGQDALAYFKRQPGRFELVHVKDLERGGKQAAVEVGRGSLDFKSIFAESGRAGIKHYFVEQDEPQQPLESIRVSIEYLRKLEY